MTPEERRKYNREYNRRQRGLHIEGYQAYFDVAQAFQDYRFITTDHFCSYVGAVLYCTSKGYSARRIARMTELPTRRIEQIRNFYALPISK